MKLSLGFSPCPNDTFIFDALVNKKIDADGLEFDVILEDVETLNQWAFEGRLDITKLSFPSFFQNTDKYILLTAGAAFGKGAGPILISKKEPAYRTGRQGIEDIELKSIALPGKNTTANLLFSFAFPSAVNKTFMLFSKIEEVVGNGNYNMGVIIHENRFTYRQKGLHKVMDLGEYWEQKMKLPVPLGGIAVKRAVDDLISLKVEKLIRKSLEYAFTTYPTVSEYVKQHAQSMSEEVMKKHIDLYVNDFSMDLTEKGKKAIIVLFETFKKVHSSGNLYRLQSELFLL